MCEDVIAERAFHGGNIDAFTVNLLIAFSCTQMRANAAGHHRHGVVFQKDTSRAIPIAFANLRHVSCDIRSRRAGVLTCRAARAHSAENRVIAIFTRDGIAGRSAFSLAVQPSADRIRIAIIPTAHILAHIAAERRRIANQRRRHGIRRLSQRLRIGFHCIALRNFRKGCACAENQLFLLLADISRNLFETDDRLRIFLQQPVFIGAEQIRSACHGVPFSLALRKQLSGFLIILSADMIETFHLLYLML